MSNFSSGDQLKIITFNAQGLRNSKHRKANFHYFRKNKYDIICIQEAYLLQQDRHLISLEWGSHFHLVEGTKRSKGLVTLFSDKIKESHVIFSNDRIIISSVKFGNEAITIINIYAPCDDKEKILFFQHIARVMEENNLIDNGNIIILGDTNTVLSNSLDIIAGNPHSKKTVKEFKQFVDNHNLVDIWRVQNSSNREIFESYYLSHLYPKVGAESASY